LKAQVGGFIEVRVELKMSTLPQMIASEIESVLYDQMHKLLGQIASDYSLDHGLLVDKYLVQPRGKSPPPQFIYAASEGSVEAEAQSPSARLQR